MSHIEDNIDEIYQTVLTNCKDQYLGQKEILKRSIKNILLNLKGGQLTLDDSQKLKSTIDVIEGIISLHFLKNFYVILKDENIKHQVFAFMVKKIKIAGYIIPKSEFNEVMQGVIKMDLLKQGMFINF